MRLELSYDNLERDRSCVELPETVYQDDDLGAALWYKKGKGIPATDHPEEPEHRMEPPHVIEVAVGERDAFEFL